MMADYYKAIRAGPAVGAGQQRRELILEICRDGLNAPWGFRLYGGRDFESPLIVTRVTPSSAAWDVLRAGDVILTINDADATQLKHAQALDLIASAGSSLKLTIIRDANVTAPPVSRSPSRGATPTRGGGGGEAKVPKLADIMKESLRLKEQGQLHTIRTQGFRGTPLSRASPQPSKPATTNLPSADITSYLPQPPPRLSSSSSRGHYYAPQSPAPHSSLMTNVIRNASNGTGAGAGSGSGAAVFSPSSSGRSSPSSSSVLDLQGGGDPNSPRPVGVWVPPVHQPNARLVHLQYNTPLGLYSAHNVADSVEKMTGTKIEWVNQRPSTRYLDDIRDSATYKFVQEIEGRCPTPPRRMDFEQSRTIKNLNRYFHLDDEQAGS